MFFKQILSNIKKNNKDNGLFFATLLIAIVAFYTLLSLESQDVMRFLKTLEGDAISKLMLLVPMVYIVSLFFVFFLVYFAYKYQMENRRKEFGLYLMCGMKRGRLFLMLMCETILNSILSVLIGIPLALLLTESISLTTARLVGLGIIGHQFSLSAYAILGTIGGFFLIQLAAMMILSVHFCRMEPATLLRAEADSAQKTISGKQGMLSFVLGLAFLAAAYIIGVKFLRSFEITSAFLILLFGTLGTFWLYRGLGSFMEHALQMRKAQKSGLYTFTGRQLQENVLNEHSSLAVSSLLLLMALACISFGLGMGLGRTAADSRACDFSLMGTEEEVTAFVQNEENQDMIAVCYPMYIGDVHHGDSTILVSGLIDALEAQPQDDLRDNIIENLRINEDNNSFHMLPVSSFNELLASMGEEQIQLSDNQAAFYSRIAADAPNYTDIWEKTLESGAYVEFIMPDGSSKRFDILPHIYYNNIVADRAITLSSTLIVPDDHYAKCNTDEATKTPFSWNIRIKDDIVKSQGLLPSIMQMDERLIRSGLSYDSYLGGIGRNLFYTVASSYLSIYLGVLFLLIANTVLVLKYLIWQKKNHHRYLTLMMLGAEKKAISLSMGTQIRLYFLLVLGVAVLNSVFAIWSMFTSFVKLPAGVSMQTVILLAGIALVCFVLVELLYIYIVQRKSRKEILSLHVSERPE